MVFRRQERTILLCSTLTDHNYIQFLVTHFTVKIGTTIFRRGDRMLKGLKPGPFRDICWNGKLFLGKGNFKMDVVATYILPKNTV